MFTVREATSHAAGAVSVLQLEGEGSLAAASELARRTDLAPGDLFVATLAFEGEELDEALVVVRSVASVELHLHGSPPLVDQLIEILHERLGATAFEAPATLEAQAEALVAAAPCADGARILLDQAAGALRSELEVIGELETEAGTSALRVLLQRGQNAKFALRPAVVVLAGPVNAGKSTLFNLLVGEDRALTSDVEGTTRDLVRARGLLGPWPIDWVDTAGARELFGVEGDEQVEREGQRLAQIVRTECDLCFWLAPAGSPEPEPSSGPVTCCIETFGDQSASRPNAICVPDDPEGAAALILERFEASLDLEQPLWTPGAAVPFEGEHLAAIVTWLELEGAARVAAVQAWLSAH